LTDLLLAMAYHRKGEVEAAKGWWRDAEAWFQKETAKLSGLQAVRGPDKMRWEDWLLAQVLRKEAATLLKEEFEENPEVARLHDKIKNFEPATYDYDLALLLQPNEPRLWLARARRHADLKRDKDAEADFAKAVEINPKDPQMWVDRARIYAALGQIDNAARDFSTALEVRPRDSAWVLRLFREDLVPREKVLAKLSRDFRPQDGELQALIEERQTLQKWTKALAGRKLIQQRTEMAGGTAGSPFEVVPKDPSFLNGFTVWAGLWNNRMVIRGLQPIFLSATGASDGPGCGHCSGPSMRIVAKKGYAVAGIVAKKTEGEILLHGLKIVFMRIDGSRLDPKDSYESDWLGGQGGQDIRLGSDGRPIIGIFGRAGQAIDALGLVQLELDVPKGDKKP
jgi:tetratricopeptide (TPR) repeat protein